jgi:Tfp pilus assembly protein PilF
MLTRVTSVGIAFLLAQVPQDVKGLAVPPEAEQARVRKELRETHRLDYAKRGREDRRALAQRLHGEAGMAKDAVMKFVLLSEACDLAADSLDLEMAASLVDAIAKAYTVTASPMLTAAVATARKGVRAEEDAARLADICLRLSVRYMCSGEYDSAGTMAQAARDIAVAAKLANVVERARAVSTEAAEAKKEHDQFRRAELLLAVDKDDAGANLAYGRFLCFYKEEWTKGLPYLSKAKEAVVRAVVEKETSPPLAPEGRAEMGNMWYDLAAKETERAPYRKKYFLRALHWYQQAWPALPELEKARLHRRLDEAEAATGRINLFMARTNVVSGVWTVTADAMGSPEGALHTILEVLYLLPVEYDLEMTVIYSGIPTLVTGLSCDGTRFYINLDSRNGSAIADLSGKPPDGTRFNGEALPEGKPTDVIILVRRNMIAVSIDGKIVLQWRGIPKDFIQNSTWTPKSGNVPFLGYHRNFAGGGSYRITRMFLVPVSGRGRRL